MGSELLTKEDLEPLKNQLTELKRVFTDDKDSGSSNSKRPSSGRNSTSQKNFRIRLIERDSYCVISKATTFEAAHIIPHSYAKSFHGIWRSEYQSFCYNEKMGVDDIRNGLLLSPTLHVQFDQYLFTIIFVEGKYWVKKSAYFHIPDLTETELQFGDDPEKMPAEKFLDFHNKQFEDTVLKASAEKFSFDRQDSNLTVVHKYDALNESQIKWIEEQSNYKTPFSDCLLTDSLL